MTNKSISDKLSELFELHKSGAITKDEYDNLKKQVMLEDGVPIASDVNKQKPERAEIPDMVSPAKKGSKIWVFAAIGVIIIGIVFIVFKTDMFSSEPPDSFTIKDKIIKAELLPAPGLYTKVAGYPQVIRVVIKHGKIFFQVGSDMNSLVDDEIKWINDEGGFGLNSSGDGDVIQYIGNGEIEITQFEKTYGTFTKVKFIKEEEVSTTKKETNNANLKPESYLKEFFNSYLKQDEQLAKSIYPGIGIFYMTNPGSRCSSSITNSIKFIELTIPAKSVFNKVPEGDKCGGYPGVKDGFYFKTITNEKLPSYAEYVNNNEVFKTVELPGQYSNSPIVEVTIVQNEFWQATFYFAQIDGAWYLFCQSFCDCSA